MANHKRATPEIKREQRHRNGTTPYRYTIRIEGWDGEESANPWARLTVGRPTGFTGFCAKFLNSATKEISRQIGPTPQTQARAGGTIMGKQPANSKPPLNGYATISWGKSVLFRSS
jgi:hypothetical protein